MNFSVCVQKKSCIWLYFVVFHRIESVCVCVCIGPTIRATVTKIEAKFKISEIVCVCEPFLHPFHCNIWMMNGNFTSENEMQIDRSYVRLKVQLNCRLNDTNKKSLNLFGETG